uniref:Uncharacterized protein n=1 Tax=Steinernema glaseri TaxID=37863 RepID=A0A1I7YLW3_9BILA
MTSEIDPSFAALNINRHVFDGIDNIRTYEKDFTRNNPSETQSPRSSPSSSDLKVRLGRQYELPLTRNEEQNVESENTALILGFCRT